MSSPSPNSSQPSAGGRPDFMLALGLLPPYTLEDVKQAYLAKVKLAHPDHGGSATDFRRIQDAYEQARHYVGIQVDRRAWIAGQVDRYLAQQAVETRLREFGATLSIPHPQWLEESLGDFAELTAAIEGIQLVDRPIGNTVVDFLVQNRDSLARLKRLELPGCELTLDRALQLSSFSLLSHLDLSRNRLNGRVIALAEALPLLESMRLEGSRVGWFSLRRLNRILKKRQESALIRNVLSGNA